MEEGTVVFINNHNLNMSPKLWDEPDNYDPSRFLDPRSGQFSKPEFFQVSSCPITDRKVPADLGPVWPNPGLLNIFRTRHNMYLDRKCFSHEKYFSQLRQDSLRQWNFWRDLERKVFASLGFKPLTWSTLILADLSKAAWPVALACP